MESWIIGFILLFIKLMIVLGFLLLAAGWMVWVERKLLGRFQVRFGPNRAGRFGVLQPVADIIKMVTKEDVVPEGADRFIFLFAPAIPAITTLLLFAVVPFGEGFTFRGSLGVYGVALGGWASNSKYSLLGGIRGVAQMISYEVPLVLSVVPVIMLSGSFSLADIVNAQARYPFIVVQPVSFILFFISAAAEIKRIPFDLPEAENELVAGYHTEYSGMRFGLYFLGEYISLIVLGSLVAVFFWGGWHGPFLPPLIWFMIKVGIVIFFLIWMRGTLPRLRYDQLMRLSWKVLIPMALLNIVVSGAVMRIGN
jgi:NADH-quinone oxidoreductase subunit H